MEAGFNRVIRPCNSFGFTQWVSQLARWTPSFPNEGKSKAASWSHDGNGQTAPYPWLELEFRSRENEDLPSYGLGDTVGFTVDFGKMRILLTKNEERVHDAAFHKVTGRLYPCVGMNDRGSVRVIFGSGPQKPFMWVPGRTCDLTAMFRKWNPTNPSRLIRRLTSRFEISTWDADFLFIISCVETF
jgi:hypothetical protein